MKSDNRLILKVKDLEIRFDLRNERVYAVNGVSFDIKTGETLGIVGESGSGKSVATQAILQLTPRPPGKVIGGEIWFNDQDLLTLNDDAMNQIRGNDISMIFQEPMTSLNPIYTIQDQLTEALKYHCTDIPQSEYKGVAIKALHTVGIPSPESRLTNYPHELSGGMRQRVMIAMALICQPQLLIADEPTTALDVTIQAQVLALINDLQKKNNMSVILITHDLGVIAQTADTVNVMYAGTVVETGTVSQIFDHPRHPYTQGLLRSIPSYAAHEKFDINARLQTIPGIVPSMKQGISGCPFFDRCEVSDNDCTQIRPTLRNYRESGQRVACIKLF